MTESAGRIVTAGTPEDVAKVKESYTGRYLRELLVRRGVVPEARRDKGGSKKQAAE